MRRGLPVRRRPAAYKRAAAVALALVSTSVAPGAHAEPQLSFGVTTGYGARHLRDDVRGAAHLGARGSLLLARSRNRDLGIGPYVEGLTVAFADVQLGGGVEVLLPGFDSPAFVLSAGPFVRHANASWSPGAAGTLFMGFREHNFHGVYGMANGLFVQGRLGFGDSRQAEVLGGVQLDLALFTLPFLLLWGSLK